MPSRCAGAGPGVRAQPGQLEPSDLRVVDPPAHVDRADLVQVLVAGEGAGQADRRDEHPGRRRLPGIRRSATAPASSVIATTEPR